MNRPLSRTLAALSGAAIAAPLLTIPLADPAQAASCTPAQHKEIATPGADTDLYVGVCGVTGTDRHGAYLVARWTDGGGGATDGERKFDGLRLTLNVERYDSPYVIASWSIAGEVNRNESGDWVSPIIWANSTLDGGWTGDGFVAYNVDRDGGGDMYWELAGSPSQQ